MINAPNLWKVQYEQFFQNILKPSDDKTYWVDRQYKKEAWEISFHAEYKSQRFYNPCKKQKSTIRESRLQSRRNCIYFHGQFSLTLIAAVIAWALEYSWSQSKAYLNNTICKGYVVKE